MSNHYSRLSMFPVYPITPLHDLERHKQRRPKEDQKDLVTSINITIKGDNEADYNQAVHDTFERVLAEAQANQARGGY
ncbi:MAG: hypothetical protein HEQ32_01770 [Vampirovibrio sp.]